MRENAAAAHGLSWRSLRALLPLPLLAAAVTLVVELFNHKTLTDGPASLLDFLTKNPLAFAVDLLIVPLTPPPSSHTAETRVQ